MKPALVTMGQIDDVDEVDDFLSCSRTRARDRS
jgi:hypothetical protein